MTTYTPEEVRTMAKKRAKYRAVPVVVDGIRFASKAEARRYGELKILLACGEIEDLETQPRYPLYCYPLDSSAAVRPKVPKKAVCEYVADFAYWRHAEPVTEDVKGFITETAALKMKWFEAQYGRKVQIIKK